MARLLHHPFFPWSRFCYCATQFSSGRSTKYATGCGRGSNLVVAGSDRSAVHHSSTRAERTARNPSLRHPNKRHGRGFVVHRVSHHHRICRLEQRQQPLVPGAVGDDWVSDHGKPNRTRFACGHVDSIALPGSHLCRRACEYQCDASQSQALHAQLQLDDRTARRGGRGRWGEGERGRRGDVTRRLLVSGSPCLPVAASPRRRVRASPRLPVAARTRQTRILRPRTREVERPAAHRAHL